MTTPFANGLPSPHRLPPSTRTAEHVDRKAAHVWTVLAMLAAVLLVGLVATLHRSSDPVHAATRIDFRSTKTLAWAVELDSDSPDALHDVNCVHVRTDAYDCTGREAGGLAQRLRIQVSSSGSAWQTIEDAGRP